MLMNKGKFNALQSEVENPKHGKEEGQAVPLVALQKLLIPSQQSPFEYESAAMDNPFFVPQEINQESVFVRFLFLLFPMDPNWQFLFCPLLSAPLF